MPILIVVNNPNDWPLDIPGVELVSARAYLTDPRYSDMNRAKVFNLCRSYRYQSFGYYVSLLAAARGHKPLPSITTIQDLKLQTMIRLAGDDLDDVIQKSLERLTRGTFELSIYFGRNLAKRYDRLSLALFNLFPAPLLRVKFVYEEDRWELKNINPIPASEIPAEHWLFVLFAANEYFIGRQRIRPREVPRYDLAILYNPEEPYAPSNPKAIRRFVRAAKAVGFRPEIITKDDYGRLAEFDALFIRETTFVNHHTYRFARRAAAEGLVVIDDPQSIARCTNKVYLAELFDRHEIGHPKTVIVHKDNTEDVAVQVGFPCVLKTPDGSFSRGVVKVRDQAELDTALDAMLAKSDLVIAQEFVPSGFDWRIGVLNRKAMYACRYHMAKGHWQIMETDSKGERQYGKVETIPIEAAPKRVVQTAVKAANLIGDGLYGVDLKQVKGKVYVMEVNDNPSIDGGFEDSILKGELYTAVMRVFYDRVTTRRGAQNGRPPVPRPAQNHAPHHPPHHAPHAHVQHAG